MAEEGKKTAGTCKINGIYAHEKGPSGQIEREKKAYTIQECISKKKSNESVTRSTIPSSFQADTPIFAKKEKKNRRKTRTICEENEVQI